jgi:DNA modification methylase
MCGDSTSIGAVEKLMNGENAEISFTSPPYADQREYGGGKELSTKHLAKFISTAKTRVKYFIVNLGYSRQDGEVNTYWDDYIAEAKSVGLKMLSWNIWDRASAFSIGQQTAMFPIEHEWIFVLGETTKKLSPTIPNKHAGVSPVVTNRESDGSLSKASVYSIRSHRELGTVIRLGVDRDRSVDHPAKFPVCLPEEYIEAMTSEKEIIYEPFGGSGSTLIACEKTNRKCFMMELDPHYCDVIITRWENFTGKKAVKIDI